MIRKVSIYVVFIWLLLFVRNSVAQELLEIPPDEQLLPLFDNPAVYANVEWPEKELIEKKEIKKKDKYCDEIERTWYWFKEIIRADYLPSQIKDKLILMLEMRHGDDWVIARYCYKDLKIQIIDGRTLTIVIKPVNKVELKTPIEDYVVSRCKEVLYYDKYAARKEDITIKTPDVKMDGTNKYGKIFIDRGCFEGGRRIKMWLEDNTISWWSNGHDIIFDIQKILVPPQSKIPLKGISYIGGIPYGDKRKFIRFDSVNKIDFNEEFKKRPKEEDNVDPKKIKGLPKGQKE